VARESARIAPPSGLRVNRQSAVPVHVQLQTQLRHLISTGSLKSGMQLPTVRQLAGFLRINRNTAARALADLSQDGYLESRQGLGTFVVGRPPAREGRAARSLERLVGDTLQRARQLGFTHDELMATLATRTSHGRGLRTLKPRVLLVECNQPELTRYREQIEQDLAVSVDRMLVGDFTARVPREPDLLKSYRAIVTTFFHIVEVKETLPADGPPAIALLSEANISVLRRLTELPAGTTIGVICNTSQGSQNLLSSLQSAGLSHLVPVLACAEDDWSLDRMLEKTSIVLCSEPAAARLRERLPVDVELILADRQLDGAGVEMLRDLLLQLEATPGAS